MQMRTQTQNNGRTHNYVADTCLKAGPDQRFRRSAGSHHLHDVCERLIRHSKKELRSALFVRIQILPLGMFLGNQQDGRCHAGLEAFLSLVTASLKKKG